MKINYFLYFNFILLSIIPIFLITGPFLPDLTISIISLVTVFIILKNKYFFLLKNKFTILFFIFYFF